MRTLRVSNAYEILKRAGAEGYTPATVLKLMEILDDVGESLAKEAMEFASHAGRITVKAVDIEIATRKLFERKRVDK